MLEIGQTFGNLVILSKSHNDSKNIFFNCKCLCGNIKIIRASSLSKGYTKSCGCLKKSKEINLVGKIFGRLTVLSKSDLKIKHRALLQCECICGNIIFISANHLKSGTKSCGCLNKERFLPSYKTCKGCNNNLSIENFKKRKKIRKSGFIGSSINEYCKLCSKLRKSVSNKIYLQIKKNKISSFQYLDFNIQELKNHLEKQFETWMSWNNWKKYDLKIWNDNDQSTWTWNIDHIIPQSKFKYISMEDQSFKECWSLSNLRPYSAKQNILDGNRR